jgi:hypothetical protein
MDDLLMTLVNQQVVNLGESINLGVVDADKSRALFFVDAPQGISVTALKTQRDDRPGSSTRQNLLQFMRHPAERPDTDGERPASSPAAALDDTPADDPVPKLLPFPTRLPKRHRL